MDEAISRKGGRPTVRSRRSDGPTVGPTDDRSVGRTVRSARISRGFQAIGGWHGRCKRACSSPVINQLSKENEHGNWNYFELGLRSTDYRLINGDLIDITTQEGNFYSGVWGQDSKDQQVRRQELAHLDNIAGDGFGYNLEDFGQAKQFMEDILDGSLDGQAGVQDGSVMVSGAQITVGNGAATYDLRDPASYARMRADNADGKLDGRIGGDEPAASQMAIETSPPQQAEPRPPRARSPHQPSEPLPPRSRGPPTPSTAAPAPAADSRCRQSGRR